MREVVIQLRFLTDCLGSYRWTRPHDHSVIFRMPRDGADQVIFLVSWWRDLLAYAATAINRCGGLTNKVDWAQAVDGPLTTWKRFLPSGKGSRRNYSLHEAFRAGTTISVRAVVPDSIGLEDFTALLTAGGVYRGISPFRNDGETYGTFEVVAVTPVVRADVTATAQVDYAITHST